jgi:RNA polymerase sigma-70 factor (ECF subfamily)
MEELSDEALMLRYAAGDADAFAVLYGRHKDALYRFVRRQCHDADAAYDLVHDIWLKLIRARRRYRADARFTTYLFTAARNRMIDYFRAQVRRPPEEALVADAAELGEIADDGDDGPETRAHTRERLERLLANLEVLPQEQRETVLLYAEGLGMAEIGEITGVRAETARSRLRRALARLRGAMEGLAA